MKNLPAQPTHANVKNYTSSSLFKTGSVLVLGMLLAAGLLWWSLPLSIKRYTDVARGEALIKNINTYYRSHETLPGDTDWNTLKQVGFLQGELEGAYPQYVKMSDSTYGIVFVSDFDGPYLLWKSSERKWKIATGVYPFSREPSNTSKL